MSELKTILESDWDIYQSRQLSHLHLKSPLSGIALTSSWSKLTLDTTNFHIKVFGGFSFDDANDRIYWDSGSVIGHSLPATFIGDAGLQVTAGLGAGVTIILGLFVNEVLILETPMSFTALTYIQGYGANGIMLDSATDANILQPNSYYDIRAKAGTGETPTIQLDYFQVTIKRD